MKNELNHFSKVLVANRAEIACRVIRGAQALGYPTVAVYSEADSAAPHVQLAEQAVCLGPAPAAESYLVIEKIIAAAKSSGADAIHPGYGFLAENAAFAQACADNDIVFIGPSPEAIDLMGNKRAAKLKMQAAKVPCIPGYEDSQEEDQLIAAANNIGYPVMVKAAAGGGGRGMRLVHSAEDIAAGIRSARSEAQSAFGSGELILEKALTQARHVEIQVFADQSGQVVHLGERDCSIQRRHQKVVEESPSPAVNAELRERMGQAACAAAAAVNYVGAGTVEFLLADDGEFYFLEMNTRLQVEHPVTEMVTGTDLVAWQLQIAAGKPLPLQQDDIELTGHAIEVRLCAEDPANGFLPQTGLAHAWQPPSGEGIRCDAGLQAGQQLSPYYDSMQAKIIAWGTDRAAARQRLLSALDQCLLHGVINNKDFLSSIIQHLAFASGDYDTGFIETHQPEQKLAATRELETALSLAAALLLHDDAAKLGQQIGAACLGWRSSSRYPVPVTVQAPEQTAEHLNVLINDFGSYKVTKADAKSGDENDNESSDESGDEKGCHVQLCAVRQHTAGYQYTTAVINSGPSQALRWSRKGRSLWLSFAGQSYLLQDQSLAPAAGAEPGSDGSVTTPMDGKLLSIAVNVGDTVEKGQAVAVLEAMKMETSLLAGVAGEVTAVNATAGDQLRQGQLVIQITPAEVAEMADTTD